MNKRGAKSKYDTCVKPFLSLIQEKVRQGVIEAEIAKALGISVATLNNYKNQYKELREALTKNKGADILQGLINDGIKAARGYFIENEQVVYGIGEDGKPVVKQIIKNKVWQPPNASLNKFYAMNYGKEQGFSNDPLDYELKKAKAEFEEKLKAAQEWDLDLNNDDK